MTVKVAIRLRRVVDSSLVIPVNWRSKESCVSLRKDIIFYSFLKLGHFKRLERLTLVSVAFTLGPKTPRTPLDHTHIEYHANQICKYL